MATLTIKNLPDELHRRLKERAARNGRSLNSEILECLHETAGTQVVDADALLAEARRLRRRVRGRVTEGSLRGARSAGRP